MTIRYEVDGEIEELKPIKCRREFDDNCCVCGQDIKKLEWYVRIAQYAVVHLPCMGKMRKDRPKTGTSGYVKAAKWTLNL